MSGPTERDLPLKIVLWLIPITLELSAIGLFLFALYIGAGIAGALR